MGMKWGCDMGPLSQPADNISTIQSILRTETSYKMAALVSDRGPFDKSPE
jgi:hypothetical protein